MAKSKKEQNMREAMNNIFGNVHKNINNVAKSSKKTATRNVNANRNKKSRNRKKPNVIENHYGVLPMSCTLDIRTIGKLEAAKQVLGAHNRDAVVEDLISKSLDDLLKSKGSKGKQDYKLYYKVFMMKHRASAEHHYKQFYKNGKKNK